jgi:alkylation response protein AidB-like acyl-CoA dehydrogenase
MFSFKITPEQKLAREMAKKFMREQVEPHVEALDEHRMLPYDLIRRFLKEVQGTDEIRSLADLEASHLELDFMTRTLIAIEVSKVCPAFTLSMGASLELCGFALLYAGNREQKERFALPLFRGDKIGCWGLTEPEAGSDVQGMKTTATKDGDGYLLNGQKTFITNAPYADTFVVYAKAPAGITAFILERGMKGLSTGKPLDKMGMRGSPTGEIFMDDLRVPSSQRLGEEGKGFFDALVNLNHERAGTPALMIGIMERCLEDATAYAKTRVQFGKPIIKFQGVQFMLGRMWEKLLTSYALLWTLGQLQEQGLDISAAASAAKLYSSESATEVALDAIQVLGGYGYMRDYKVERFMRDSKLMEIGAGTSQIQLMIMARMLMKDPPPDLNPLFAGPDPFGKK